eukprot:scaffold9130_cov124-Isochrysis_galbana.AAC.3
MRVSSTSARPSSSTRPSLSSSARPLSHHLKPKCARFVVSRADRLWLLHVWPSQSSTKRHRSGRRPAHRRSSQDQQGTHHTQVRARISIIPSPNAIALLSAGADSVCLPPCLTLTALRAIALVQKVPSTLAKP